MLLSRLKTLTFALLALAWLAGVGTMLTYRAHAMPSKATEPRPRATAPGMDEPARTQAKEQSKEKSKDEAKGDEKKARGYLGLALKDADDGTVIIEMTAPDSPAAKAKIMADDIVLKVRGEPVKDAMSMIKSLAGLKAGDRVTLRLKRGDRELDVTLTAAPRPGDFGVPPPESAAQPEQRFDRFMVARRGTAGGFDASA